MPCTPARCQRPEMKDAVIGFDYVLTTRELARMIRQAGIDFSSLPEEDYDDPLGISTGAGLIFGATGGVMEAALRTAYEIATGKELADINFHDVRGLKGIKEAEVDLDGTTIKVAVAHGLRNARELMELVKSGQAQYHYETCCPAVALAAAVAFHRQEIRAKRIKGIYAGDEAMSLRKSHENPAVQQLYKEFLGQPLGEKSHQLLHTSYTPKEKY